MGVLKVFVDGSFQEVIGLTGISDHGALTGLLDDDHTQYLRNESDDTTTGSLTADGFIASGSAASPPVANKIVKDNICKAWLNYNQQGTPAVTDSFNVTSVADDALGEFTVTWDKDFSNTNYCVSTFAREQANNNWTPVLGADASFTKTAGTMAFFFSRVRDHGSNQVIYQDSGENNIIAFGAQS